MSDRSLMPPMAGIRCVSANERYCATVVARFDPAATCESRQGSHVSVRYSPTVTLLGGT